MDISYSPEKVDLCKKILRIGVIDLIRLMQRQVNLKFVYN